MRATIALFLLLAWQAAARFCTLYDHERVSTVPPLVVPPRGAPRPLGPHTNVTFERIPFLPGLVNGDKTSAVIVYPTEAALDSDDTFPFLSFAHATFVGGSFPPTDIAYKTLLTQVVSLGFIVVAPESCTSKECASNFAKDQLTTITDCKSNRTLHPALAAADFTRVGVFGHSMGAMATLASAGGSAHGYNPASYSIVAAASMHPCWDPLEVPRQVSVPILLTAGDKDVICPDGCARTFFGDVAQTGQKVLFDVAGSDHFDPTDLGYCKEDRAVALFLACWVRGEHCDLVYGPGGHAICSQVTNGTLANCTVAGRGPASRGS